MKQWRDKSIHGPEESSGHINASNLGKRDSRGTCLSHSDRGLKIETTPEAIAISVRVQCKSSRSKVVGIQGRYLKVKVNSPPIEGRANRECLHVLARWLGVRSSQLAIIRGQSSRLKVVKVAGNPVELKEKLRARITPQIH